MHPDTLEFLGRERRAELDAEAARNSLSKQASANPVVRPVRQYSPWALLIALGQRLERAGGVMERVGRARFARPI